MNTISKCMTSILVFGFSNHSAAQDAAGEDCSLAERYYELAQDSLAEYDENQAAGWLERAVDECPRFIYYQEFGEIRMQSREESGKAAAVEAFISAHEVAETDQERAAALYQYASLLNREGDPQNANGLIIEAQRLDKGSREIAALAESIRYQVDNPTQEKLVRALSASLYQPLRMARATPSGNESTTSSAPVRLSGSTTSSRPVTSGPSVNIPIHFEYNSSAVDADSIDNLRLIAETLQDEQLRGGNFIFVGHTDRRGSADYNLRLSRERAFAIYEEVINIDRDLEGRISIVGRGAEEPLDLGTTEEAHWRNRRLQILVE